jgi:glucosamine-6-phosphate deaminase
MALDYGRSVTDQEVLPVRIVETEVDLYWDIALEMYGRIEAAAGKPVAFILPVGPVFQYRRFAELLRRRPLDLGGLHCFFMDEYLGEDGNAIPVSNPLSFRGFIEREFLATVPPVSGLRVDHVYFPDPRDPMDYDRRIDDLGGIHTCFAGVGINGHLAFNEAEPNLSPEEFAALGTRVIGLTPETITTNAHTALRGAYELIPERAVTVGMKQILESRSVRVYFNRPWQNSVVRKLLFGEVGAQFPASLLRNHPDALLTMTAAVAEAPEFALK